ncbi:MAG: HIRAN domain-containing protein [Liquorilactobacillus ghanensis]|uniref:HIRAN domain-containing protein n=1 Tax=Liquorilactobacillus ghanensis TaxID=399370 RepID=UPI0039EBDC4C
MAKTCEICGRKIGFFDPKYTTSDKKIICQNCWELYKKRIPVVISHKESINEIVKYIDSKEAIAYCEKHQILNIPEAYRQNEIARKAKIEKEKKEEEERQKKLELIRKLNEQEQKNKKFQLEQLKKKIILKFNVSGLKYYDIGKAIAFAKREKMFTPFNGMNASALKDDPYEKVYETHLDGIISSVDFEPEPENKYDSNAIKVIINIKESKFKIGYVPKKLTSKVKSILDKSDKKEVALKVGCYLDGGKFKKADEDPNDFSDNPKLRIYTGVDDCEFNIELSDDNL